MEIGCSLRPRRASSWSRGLGHGSPALVTVSLLPCTTHHLDVTAHVREMGPPCWYGGYTLHTTRDRNDAPLAIVQSGPSCHLFLLPLVYR